MTRPPGSMLAKPPEAPQPDHDTVSLTAAMQIDAQASASGEGATPALPRFSMIAYTGGAMRLAGWKFPVVVDLAGMNIPSQLRPIRVGHNTDQRVGHTTAIRIENGASGGQLVAGGVVSCTGRTAQEVVADARNGFPWQASIGAAVEEFEFTPEGRTVVVNGQEFAGPVNVVRRSTLGEISFVDLGADGNTSARVAASAKKESQNMDGQDPQKQNEQDQPNQDTPKVEAKAQDVAATSTADVMPDPVAEMRAKVAAETQRIAGIRELCAGKLPGVEAKAIAEGWDLTKTELEVLRASRPKAPMGYVVTSPAITGAVLEAACLLSAKIHTPEAHCDEQALDVALKRFRSGISLQELFLEAAIANGYVGHSFRSDARRIMEYAFASHLPGAGMAPIQAALSNIDIGGILSSVANKFLLEGFFSVERTWRNICAVRSVGDFKTVTSYRLIGTDQYEQVAPGGELKHGTLGQETYSNKADTYGLLLGIDRRDIINDDLGAISTVPRKLGRGSGLKINDVFWTIFLSNAAFFVAGNKNYLSGANTALGIDAMSAVEQAFSDQVDADGKPIGVLPAVLLVPTSLSAMATQLFKSLEIRDTTANTKTPLANPHQGKFRAEVSRYLGNSKFAGNSQKAWYLLADPADLAVIEVAFLNGQESPTIETAEADFNVLGVQLRGYHDFGVALQDPRGGVKAKGEV
ncbi:MAG: hypothetical protein IT442_13585 [Phycisphaeraceae bacterium]|nr:hypothetical protein [Phycisphaeraceae bacterium]